MLGRKKISNNKIGSKIWVFPDAELPEISKGFLKAHESIIILNLNKERAIIKLDLFFEDKIPIRDIKLEVEPERVRCFRFDNPDDINGLLIPRKVQYAMVLKSNINIVAQYGRLDTTQPNMAFYTVMGFNF
jgi:hypothetical protein